MSAADGEPAFRTISEVAGLLGVAPHVLRFWEGRFPEVAPVKRAGNRRYYRPQDVALLRALANLLHGQGYTLRGVQTLLAERGAAAIAAEYGGGEPVRASGREPTRAPETLAPEVRAELTAIRDRLAEALEG